MAWRDKIENKRFKITTGDGAEYFPLWKLEPKELEFNYTQNEYPDLAGTFVDRRLYKGERRTLNVYFDGENAHDIGQSFLDSAKDVKEWIIEHPLDGILRVQPLSIRSVPTLNTVNLSIDVQETITQEGINTTNEPIDQITSISDAQNNSAVTNINDQPRDSSNIGQIQNDINSLNKNFEDIITDQDQASTFKNLIREADRLSQTYVENATQIAIAMNDINRFIGTSNADVADRLRAMTNSTRAIFSSAPSFPGIEFLSYAGFGASSNIVSVANIAANPEPDDYITVEDVREVQDQIADYWNETIDQFSEYGPENGRIGSEIYELPEEPTRLAFNAILACLGNLDQIAFNAKIQVETLIEEPTNLILLCYKLYGGLGENDENIDELIRINQLGPNDMIQIEPGTKIIYLI